MIKVHKRMDCKFCGGVDTVQVWSMDKGAYIADCDNCEMMYPPKDTKAELYDIIKRTTVGEKNDAQV